MTNPADEIKQWLDWYESQTDADEFPDESKLIALCRVLLNVLEGSQDFTDEDLKTIDCGDCHDEIFQQQQTLTRAAEIVRKEK